jgi:hypothetical protein
MDTINDLADPLDMVIGGRAADAEAASQADSQFSADQRADDFGLRSTASSSSSVSESKSQCSSGHRLHKKRKNRVDRENEFAAPDPFGIQGRYKRKKRPGPEQGQGAPAAGNGSIPMDDDAGGQEAIRGMWKTQSFDEEDWSNVIDEPSDDPNYCFFCDCTQNRREQSGFPAFIKFERFILINYENMQRVALAIMAVEVYDNQLRPFTHKMKAMRAQVLLAHFESHAPCERILMIQDMRTLNYAKQLLKQQLREVDDVTGDERLHERNFNQYLRLSDKLNELVAKIAKSRPHDN